MTTDLTDRPLSLVHRDRDGYDWGMEMIREPAPAREPVTLDDGDVCRVWEALNAAAAHATDRDSHLRYKRLARLFAPHAAGEVTVTPYRR